VAKSSAKQNQSVEMADKHRKEIVMSIILNGDLQARLGGKLAEISRQVFLQKGYGFDPEKLDVFLQRAIEGRFQEGSKWTRDADGVIRFTLISNGKAGEEWITHFTAKGLSVGRYAQSVLRYKNFKPTKAGTPHHIAVLPGKLYSDDGRITRLIRADAKKRKMTDPHAEVACLIRDMFSDEEIKEMGLDWIITMHEPIPDSDGSPSVLGTYRFSDCRLSAYYGEPDRRWDRDNGFAFSVPQGPVA